MPDSSSNRNHLVELMRFLSASWVVLFHFNQPVPHIDNWYRNFCKFGYLGVVVFFILSGYCIFIAKEHSGNPKEFLTRRLFRIYPPYWFSLLVVLLCACTIWIVTGTNSIPMPKTIDGIFAAVILYIKPLSIYWSPNWVYWTLPFELFFYLIIFVSLYLNSTLQKVFIVVFLAAALLLAKHGTRLLFFLPEFGTFMLGYALYIVLNIKKERLFGLLLLFTSMFAIYTYHKTADYLLTAGAVCLLFLFERRFRLPENWFSNLGNYSYSLYLIHVPVGVALLGFIKTYAWVQKSVLLDVCWDVTLLCLLIGLSSIMYKFIELPSIRLARKIK